MLTHQQRDVNASPAQTRYHFVQITTHSTVEPLSDALFSWPLHTRRVMLLPLPLHGIASGQS